MNEQKLPNSTLVLVLGIISILGCCCYGIIGLVCGIVGLVLAKKDEALYLANPTLYTDFQTLKTGKILCYVGIVLSALTVIYMVILIMTVGLDALSYQELMQERLRDLMGQ